MEALLDKYKDEEYAEFMAGLMPGIDREKIIGVRTPELKKIAKELIKEGKSADFVSRLPHEYFEENQVHGFIISQMKDFDECIKETERFLPYIDNWATCDQTSPKIFQKHKNDLLPYIEKWLASDRTYTIRFAIGMLMKHYLDEDFRPKYAEKVAKIRSEEYYVNMERAWYMATALAKQWDQVIKLIEECSMDEWTHNKTIQKARESYRVSMEQKDYLKSLRIKHKSR